MTIENISAARSNEISQFNKKGHDIIFQWRLRWYQKFMQEKLIRYKHAIILISALVLPTLSVFNAIIIQPILAIINPTLDSWHSLFILIGIQSIFVCWILLQDKAVTGQPFRNYLRSLPITLWQIYFIDVKILIVANNLCWVPIILACVFAPYNEMHSSSDFLIFLLRILILAVSIILAQLSWIHRRFDKLIGIFIVDMLFALGVFVHDAFLLISLLIFTLGMLAGLTITPTRSNIFGAINLKISYFYSVNKPSLSLFPITKIQYAILIREYPVKTFLRISASLITLVLGWCVVYLSSKAISALSISLIILAINTLIISGLTQQLYASHGQYFRYIHTLPLSKWFWVMRDCWLAFCIIVIQTACYTVLLLLFHQLTISVAVLLVIGQIPLILVLYPLQNTFGKFGTLASYIATVAWVFSLIIIIH